MRLGPLLLVTIYDVVEGHIRLLIDILIKTGKILM
jgi:hypothetical protein